MTGTGRDHTAVTPDRCASTPADSGRSAGASGGAPFRWTGAPMSPAVLRRLTQAAIALTLAGLTILVTEWAYPAGHLAIRLGQPFYSRAVADASPYVTIDITIKNVGAEPVLIDREHFLLVDNTGQRYASDPSTHFLQNHFDVVTIPAGYQLHGATVFKIAPGRRAAAMLFITNTGQIVRFRL
jgi:hypothetical protein